jgi:hypothetical protein
LGLKSIAAAGDGQLKVRTAAIIDSHLKSRVVIDYELKSRETVTDGELQRRTAVREYEVHLRA